LIKVQLDTIPRALSGEGGLSYDGGAPIYYPIDDSQGNTVRALPVGILLQFVQENENEEDACVPKYYMYCVPIKGIFEVNRSIQLIKTPIQNQEVY
jgi:hypothetical protein